MKALRTLALVGALASAIVSSPRPAAAQATSAPALPPPPLPQPAPIRVASLTAYKYGHGPKTLVLIPGLACGAWTWDSTLPALVAKYTVYTVTFDGFDGMPATKPPYISAFTASIEALMRAENMRAPVLVGHSLGGTVALDVAIDRPASLAGVAVVDSLPIFPPLQPGETLASRREREPAIASAMMAASDADYAAGSRANIGTMVTDPAMADAVNAHAIKSDRATVVGSFVELAETDLTPHLAKIAVPVFVIASGAQYGAEATRQYFAAQFQGVPKVSVTAIPDARHFVMIDQPAAIQSALTGFLATLK